MVKVGRVEEATTKQRQIAGDNLLKSAPLVKLSGPENFLLWLSAVQTVIKKLPAGFDEIRLAKIIKDTFDNTVDTSNTKGMMELGEIMCYVRGKYVSDINIIMAT